MPRRKYDIVNEQAILVAILRDDDSRRRALACAKPQDFFGAKHRVIFAAVAKCEEDGVEPAPTDVATRTDGREFGGLEKLRELFEADPPVDLDRRLDALRRDAARARVKDAAKDVVESAEDPEAEYDEVVADARALLQGLKDAPLRSGDADSGDDWLESYRRRRSGESGLFVSTGYEPLDGVLTEGYAPGSITVVAGRPRMGKTMLMIDTARRLRRLEESRVLIGALEKGREYILNLLVACVTGIDKKLILKNPEDLTDAQHNKVERAVEWLFEGGRLTIIDNPIRSLIRAGKWSNEAAVDKMGEVLSQGAYDIAIWDIWQRALKNTNPEQISAAVGAFYEIGKSTGTHNIVVQQLHRRVEDRSKDKARRPTLNDLKQSGAYEEFADTVLFVHREKVFKPRTPKGDVMEVTIGKQKLGEDQVTMVARFQPETCRLIKPRLAEAADLRPGASFLREE